MQRRLLASAAIAVSLILPVSGAVVVPAYADDSAQTQSNASSSGGFASERDLNALNNLSDAEQQELIDAIDGVSKEDFQTGDPQVVHDKVTAHLDANSGDSVDTQAVPLVILAARVVACIGPAYAALRSIESGSPDAVAASIAGAVAGCVTGGGASVIKSAILKNKGVIAKGLKAAGLGTLAGLLTGDSPKD